MAPANTGTTETLIMTNNTRIVLFIAFSLLSVLLLTFQLKDMSPSRWQQESEYPTGYLLWGVRCSGTGCLRS
jgi:hypothetical protein